MIDGRKDSQPKSSFDSLFQSQAIIILNYKFLNGSPHAL